MEPFRDAVDGTFDVADQLARYMIARAERDFEAERAAKRRIDSVAAFERRREDVRRLVRSRIGGLPDLPTDPRVGRVGVRRGAGYDVELVTVESLPDFTVTVNCYVPADEGPHPGVLFTCGHAPAAKADPLTQRACIDLARNGFVVAVFDPIGQGEREQYRDPATGEAIVEGGGGVWEHCYAGQQCFLAGGTLARFMVHDARAVLTYLAGRPDVDADRLGGTGTSGGGIQAGYLALLDDRIDAAALCCSVTERAEWLRTGKRIDAEQVIPGAIPAGLNFDEFVTAIAPDPVFVGAARWDEYFPLEGVHETVDRARRRYELYDAGDALTLREIDRPHCSVFDFAPRVIEWFCDVLGDRDYEPPPDRDILDETDLQCTSGGSVRGADPDERSIDELIAADVAERVRDIGNAGGATPRSAELGPATDPDAVRERLRDRFDLDRGSEALYPRVLYRGEHEDLDVEHVCFKAERNPDVVVTGVLLSADGPGTRPPAVVLYEDGTDEVPDRRADLRTLAAAHGTVLVFDPRGVGAVRNRAIPIPTWVEDYDGIYGTHFKLAYDALLLGTSLFGMRVLDVTQAISFLSDRVGTRRISLVGEGVGAYHALYAAGASSVVERVDLRDLGPSFRELATTREYPFEPALTVQDILELDVPVVEAALEARGVRVSHEERANPTG